MGQENKQKYDPEYYADRIGRTDHSIDPENGKSAERERMKHQENPGGTTQETDERPFGKYSMLREQYLKNYKRRLYREYLKDGTLDRHLRDVQELAQQRLDTMIPRMAENLGVTEELKRQDQMKWVGMMNNIKHSVEETIYEDLIYS